MPVSRQEIVNNNLQLCDVLHLLWLRFSPFACGTIEIFDSFLGVQIPFLPGKIVKAHDDNQGNVVSYEEGGKFKKFKRGTIYRKVNFVELGELICNGSFRHVHIEGHERTHDLNEYENVANIAIDKQGNHIKAVEI